MCSSIMTPQFLNQKNSQYNPSKRTKITLSNGQLRKITVIPPYPGDQIKEEIINLCSDPDFYK